MSSTHPINRTTEWDDLQIKYGNYAPLTPEVKQEELSRQAQEAAADLDPLAARSLQELNEMEDIVEEDTLERYRQARLQELRELQKRARFGQMTEINMADYQQEVTEASKELNGQQVVLCILYKDSVPASAQLCQIMTQLASQHPEVKFCRGISDKVVPNYKDSAVPTVLVYRNGACISQIVGVSKFGGPAMSLDTVDWVLGRQQKLWKVDIDNPFKVLGGSRGHKGVVARLSRGQNGYESDESEEDSERHTVANDKGYGDLRIDDVAKLLR